jgi:hypothetical protein
MCARAIGDNYSCLPAVMMSASNALPTIISSMPYPKTMTKKRAKKQYSWDYIEKIKLLLRGLLGGD